MSKLVPSREDAPHTAVLRISYEVHENLPSGDLRGTPVDRGEKIFQIRGRDRAICLRKLSEFFQEMINEQRPRG